MLSCTDCGLESWHFYTAIDATWYHICLKLILVFKATLILVSPWSSALPEKFPEFYATRGFITATQVPATCLYPEPEQSNSCLSVPLLESSF
jgi:hypothetical protein